MPNHIQNRITFIAPEFAPEPLRDEAEVRVLFDNWKQRVDVILDTIKGEPFDDGEPCKIDFEKIIPSPQVIKDVGEVHFGIVTAVNASVNEPLHDNPLIASLERINRERVKLKEEDLEAYKRSLKAYKETGYAYWYDWNIANWGTKWNAYAQNDERDTEYTIHFQTAWSYPKGIVDAIAKMFPDVQINWDYSDEDSGCNCGRIILRNGHAYVSKLVNESKEAFELYFELHPDKKQYYRLSGNSYEYIED